MNNFQFSIFNFQKNIQGFTLLEMIISIGIFSVLVVASIGVTLSVSNAQIKASNIQATQDNIRFSMELMTKEMRTGSQYTLSSFCNAIPGQEVSFLTSFGEKRAYYLSGDKIMRLKNTTVCISAQPLMADEVAVERLRFVISGTTAGPNDGQPRITVAISVRSKSLKNPLESRMNLQTTVVQRLRDL